MHLIVLCYIKCPIGLKTLFHVKIHVQLGVFMSGAFSNICANILITPDALLVQHVKVSSSSY